MTAIEPDDQEEKPLDPAMESVRRKMVRLQIVSGAIMFVSLMAVFGAVVYKTTRSEPKETAATVSAAGVPSDAPLAATVSLPLGFKVQSTSFSAGQILFYGETVDGKRKALVFDLRTGRTVADVTVAGN
ncbi:hypothetical protein Rleg4DRAFT_2656 [Rhizobium leguminosarum bv. trifolii WSM2297]|uniref:Transmembrane protein n=1 Tax=Rhizobium leguminosarum bv. trifolii WSM2297 TaxID=754762 RepID=J0W5G0_RHILT|nr:hypothetical protein [Rhizobium leguminosarum]EJC80986.1 hypothetical protein Rleg4DRAFT_2656 [Rhizobium leguminosarum bv. trifolii WSM2297]